MSEKKLYVVEVTRTLVVVADDENDAIFEAEDAAREDDSDPSVHAAEMSYLPSEWDIDCIPWGERDKDDPDRTIRQWIEMGAAPKYKSKTELRLGDAVEP